VRTRRVEKQVSRDVEFSKRNQSFAESIFFVKGYVLYKEADIIFGRVCISESSRGSVVDPFNCGSTSTSDDNLDLACFTYVASP